MLLLLDWIAEKRLVFTGAVLLCWFALPTPATRIAALTLLGALTAFRVVTRIERPTPPVSDQPTALQGPKRGKPSPDTERLEA